MPCGEPVEIEREDESAAWWRTVWEWLTKKSTIQRISLGLTSSFKSLLAMRCGCNCCSCDVPPPPTPPWGTPATSFTLVCANNSSTSHQQAFSFSFTHLVMWFCSAGLTTAKTSCSLTCCSTWKMPVSVGAVATALSRVHATSASVNCPHCPTRWGRGTRQEGQVCPWSRFSVPKPVWPSLERMLSLTGDRTAFSCITWHLFSFFPFLKNHVSDKLFTPFFSF